MKRFLPHLTYANVVSTICLFLLLGGGAAYAADQLAKNSVGSKQIKKDAVNSAKVKDHSLQATDFATNQLPAGPRGAQGAPGAPGPQGTRGLPGIAGEAVAFGNFSSTGTIPSYAPTPVNLSEANIDHVAVGVYCLKGLSFTPRSAIVSGDNSFALNDTIATVSVDNGSVGGLSECATGERVRIRTTNAAGTLVDRAFNIWLE